MNVYNLVLVAGNVFVHKGTFKNKTENYPDSLYQDALFRKLESVARKKLVYFIHI